MSPPEHSARLAHPADVPAVTRIYNEGIADRVATFETEPRDQRDVAAWLERDLPLVVVVDRSGTVVAWANAWPYRDRDCYAGIGEFSVYVQRTHRGRGAGRVALQGLIAECERRGYWKLLSRVFPENTASRVLCRRLGFREVGVYRRHARLDGVWRDCVIVERPLGTASPQTSTTVGR